MTRTLTLLLCLFAGAFAESGGSIRGTVTLESNGALMHKARVVLMPLGKSAETGDDGIYEFKDLPAGNYDLLVHLEGLSDERRTVRLAAGGTASADFKLRLAAVHEHITVTASGREEGTLNAISSVTSLDARDLVPRAAASLGDVLENEPGIAKRSFGPGNTRPVVRGFDGDRVLVLEDGVPTGTLSSQSGDHGEPVDAANLERLEVVRGPAMLLYGSNALGGVVNAISRTSAVHDQAHDGLSGYLTGYGGTANAQGGGSAGFEYGARRWQMWASGGGQRTGEYNTPLGSILNSQTRNAQTSAGVGRYGERGYFSFHYALNDALYGIPINPAEEDPEMVNLKLRRQGVRFNTGIRNINSFLDTMRVSVNYSDYNHKELEGPDIGTEFFNKQITYRAVFDQKKRGRWLGSFGFSGLDRDYRAEGAESLAPPTTQNSVALFAVQSMDFERTRLQFGGRIERNGYHPDGLVDRSFTGFSGAVGLSQRLAPSTVFVVNYTHSYRAPALEELYNHGPHPGNVTFEIGNPDLLRERSDGIDFSVRHHSARLRAEANYFYYRLQDFVYLAPTGGIEDGLIEANYAQAAARYHGAEARLDVGVHPNVWLNFAVDSVNAELTGSATPLPRIPPVRGRAGVDLRYRNLSVRPELVLARDQSNVFPTESATAGYGVFNVNASYTIVGKHCLHTITGTVFNAGDRLYRNHLSFIKEFAPEIGRGARFSYTLRFF